MSASSRQWAPPGRGLGLIDTIGLQYPVHCLTRIQFFINIERQIRRKNGKEEGRKERKKEKGRKEEGSERREKGGWK